MHRFDVAAGLGAELRRGLREARDPGEVGALAVALGLLGDEEAAPTLLRQLERTDEDEARGYLAMALGMIRAEGAADRLLELCSKARYRPAVLSRAAIGLGLLGDKRAGVELATLLRDSNTLSAQAALCQALGLIGDRGAVGPLLELLGDRRETQRARALAAVALGQVAERDLLPWNERLSADLNYGAATAMLANARGTGAADAP